MAAREHMTYGIFSRRGFVQFVASAALSSCLPSCTSEEQKALGYQPKLKSRTAFITANETFYLVAVDPAFRPELSLESVEQRWSLELVGVDGVAQHMKYAELSEKANRVVPYTFECIGNNVGGSLIGNAEWHVLPLKEVLKRAGLNDEVKSVMFEGLDDFFSSVSIERATDDYAFIALKMNGVPLSGGHGFPARVILPDLYGMKQPRWLRRITLLRNKATTSYWERRGWAGEVAVKNFSRLDPIESVQLGEGRTELTGVAFAGARGIARVEISFDEGLNWQPCQLETESTPHVWSLWRFKWQKPVPGEYTIQVRATDGNGHVQTATRTKSYPAGASGYHTLNLRVAGNSGH